jgi:hypothetical protein
MPLVLHNPEQRERAGGGIGGSQAKLFLQLTDGETVEFAPGNNDINPTTWKKILADPIQGEYVEYLMDTRIFTVEQEDLKKSTLTSMSVTRAIAVVKETYMPELLQTWLGDDSLKPPAKETAEAAKK